jgi:SWI/SNF-related matrix-associated actin-dependent regulator of chromatin subfamily A member 5
MQYGYGEWGAVKMAIRRSPKFRFDYFLRSLPVDVLGRRCEHLMRVAAKEIEDLEKKAREAVGLPVVVDEGLELPSIDLPAYKELMRQERAMRKEKMEKERVQLEQSVEELESNMKEIQDRLKELSRDMPEDQEEKLVRNGGITVKKRPRSMEESSSTLEEPLEAGKNQNYALGPDGRHHDFPPYDGSEPPKEPRKAFTHFCINTRKEIKMSLESSERKDKDKMNDILKEKWLELSEDDKKPWRIWASWDKKRYARDLAVYDTSHAAESGSNAQASKKRSGEGKIHVPKKKRKSA